jgi:hypothetical protein
VWLYFLALVLVIFGVVGGIASGGIFLIVLLPLAAIALVVALLGGGARARSGPGRRARPTRDGAPGRSEEVAPLPSSQPEAPGRVLTSPEALTDARRAEQ